jgi:riboflavin kinase/FMN adenylyltransferase
LRTKLEAFRAFGVATTVIARFDARLASLPPESFIHDVLERGLNARWVLVGDDFRFGKGAKRRYRTAAVEGAAVQRRRHAHRRRRSERGIEHRGSRRAR